MHEQHGPHIHYTLTLLHGLVVFGGVEVGDLVGGGHARFDPLEVVQEAGFTERLVDPPKSIGAARRGSAGGGGVQ